MKKIKLFSIAVMLAFVLSCVAMPTYFAFADGEENRPINIFANKGDWANNSGKGSVGFAGNTLTLTPIDVVGSAYTGAVLGQGKISFTYQLEYAEGVDPFTPADTHYQCFFGVLFSNSPTDITVPNASLSCPWSAPGGYPYMVAFDSEIQGGEDDRLKQLGLTLRRYKAVGSHDFTRWSSVEPTNATYVNSSGQTYESKIPDFYKPVTMEDCFDTDEHAVEIEIKNMYTAKGDEKDAVRIDVTFDGELCLTVIDEMPFEGEELGDVIDVDKRMSDGYVAWFAFNGYNTNNLNMWDYKVNVKSMNVLFGESNGGALPVQPSGSQGDGGCGCGSDVTAGTSMAIAGVLICCGISLTLHRRKIMPKADKK